MSSVFTYQYNNKRLGTPIPYGVLASFDQTLYNEGFKIIQPYISRTLKNAFLYEEQGDIHTAEQFYDDVNDFITILSYLFIVYRYKKLVSQNPALGITGEQINNRYQLQCVYEGLSCVTCREPIQKAFRDIIELFGLNDVIINDDNTQDCVGIGKMVINGNNEFTSFIINNVCHIKTLNQGKLLSSFSLSSFDKPSFEQTQY